MCGIVSIIRKLFPFFIFSIFSCDGFGQLFGRVISSNLPVPFAHITLEPEGKIAVADENGEFILPYFKGERVLVISAIGFKTKSFPITKSGKKKIEFELEKEIVELDEAVVNEKEVTARELLKRAKRKAKEIGSTKGLVLYGRAGEFSKDDGNFVHAIEGSFSRSFLKDGNDKVMVQSVFESRNNRKKAIFPLAGIDFMYVFKQGDPEKVIDQWHLKHASRAGLEKVDGAFVQRIVCADLDSNRISEFYIRLKDTLLIRATEDWPVPNRKAMKVPGHNFLAKFVRTTYRFDYRLINGNLLPVSSEFVHHIHYFLEEVGPLELDMERTVKVEIFEVRDDSRSLEYEGVALKPVYLLTNVKGIDYLQWENQPFVTHSTFRKQVLNDLIGKRVGHFQGK